jgi:hypothetical protein
MNGQARYDYAMEQAKRNKKSLEVVVKAIQSAMEGYERETGNRITSIVITETHIGDHAPSKIRLEIAPW